MSARKAASLNASLLVCKGGAAPAGAVNIPASAPASAEVEDKPARLEFEPQPLSQMSVSRPFGAWRAAAAIAVLVVSSAVILFWQQTEKTGKTASVVDATSPIIESIIEPKGSAADAENRVAGLVPAATPAPKRVEIAGSENIVEVATRQVQPIAAPQPRKPAVQGAISAMPSQSTKESNTDTPPSSGQTAIPPSVIVASPAALANQTPIKKKLVKPKYVIQLSAVKSISSARRETNRLQRRLGGLLKGKRLQVQKAVARGRGTIYRVNLMDFSNRSGASKLCAQIKSRSLDCIVKKR